MAQITADIRERNIIRASAVGIGANVALCGAKAAIGLISNSIAIILDALNNLSDALSSVLVLAGISLANKPANREHPFGFGRFEYLTTLTIALIILGTGVFSLVQSFDKALNPEPSEYGWAGVSVLVLAIGAKLLLSRYYRRQGEANESDTLKVTAGDALFDAVITGATMDSGLVETLKKEIAANDKVLGVYDMIIHDYGPGRKLGSVCIGVEDTMTAHEVQDLTRSIQSQILGRHGILFTIGIHAMNWKDPGTRIMYDSIMDMVHGCPGVLEVHGLYIDPKDKTISFDVVVDFSVKDKAALRSKLLEELSSSYPDYRTDIIVDSDISTS